MFFIMTSLLQFSLCCHHRSGMDLLNQHFKYDPGERKGSRSSSSSSKRHWQLAIVLMHSPRQETEDCSEKYHKPELGPVGGSLKHE